MRYGRVGKQGLHESFNPHRNILAGNTSASALRQYFPTTDTDFERIAAAKKTVEKRA